MAILVLDDIRGTSIIEGSVISLSWPSTYSHSPSNAFALYPSHTISPSLSPVDICVISLYSLPSSVCERVRARERTSYWTLHIRSTHMRVHISINQTLTLSIYKYTQTHIDRYTLYKRCALLPVVSICRSVI